MKHFFILLMAFFAMQTRADNKLSGTILGTEASVDYNTGSVSTKVNNRDCAFDGNLDTYFASYDRSKTWVGMDLGKPHVITKVGWAPRNESTYGPKRMLLGLFEGANSPDFVDAVPLYIITEPAALGKLSYADINVSRGFRYVRYVGPNDCRCNVGEIEFYGHEGEGDDTQFYQLTNLPTVCIHTRDNVDPYDKVNEITSSISLIYDAGAQIQESTGTSRLRGNSSMGFPKKPYRIKFDKAIRPLKGSVLEAPAKAKKWTLINPYDDKTLMRNIVGFEISRRMGMEYTPYCQSVDLILNGEYKGNYQLSDQVTVEKNRVPITEMEPDDNEEPELSGGYLIEMDALAGGEPSKFTSQFGIPVTIKSPDNNDITPQQKEYIEQYFNLMEEKVYGEEYASEEYGYRSMIDLDSFLKHFLTSEFTANSDMYWSTYLYKDREENRFKIGPVWDLNLGFDNDGRSYPNRNAKDWTFRYVVSYAGTIKNWVNRIISDPYAEERMGELWDQARGHGQMTEKSLIGYVDSLEMYLDQSQHLNYMRWDVLNSYLFANPQIAGSYKGEVEVLRRFIRERFVWFDDKLEYGDPYGRKKLYQIANADDLVKFANAVNNEGMLASSAILIDDIDLTGRDVTIGMNNSSCYRGNFDGDGHSIRVDMNRRSDNAALFGYLSGTVKNLEVKGNIRTSAKFAAGIAAHTYGANIRQCASLVDISSTVSGDGTHAGIVAVSETGATIEDCLFAGTMKGSRTTCCGGIIGWASGQSTVNRCLQIADIQVSESGSHTIGRNYSNIQGAGNLYLAKLNESGDATQVDFSALQSGEICFMLNANKSEIVWRQNLDNDQPRDDCPFPLSSHGMVYAGPEGYTNHEYSSSYTLNDGTELQNNAPFKVAELHYKRAFGDDRLQEWYLPADVPVESLNEQGLKAFSINNVCLYEDGEQYVEIFPMQTGVLAANTPYLVKTSNYGVKDIIVRNVQVESPMSCSIDCNSLIQTYKFIGTNKPVKLSSENEYVLEKDRLIPVSGYAVMPQRWYLLVEALIPKENDLPRDVKIVVKDENTDEISTIQINENMHEWVYDLQGRRVENVTKHGLYLINGRKVLGK